MTRFKKLLLPFTAVLVLAWAGAVLGQNSQGGAFLTNFDYILDTPNGWLWRTNTPWRIGGSTDDAFETTVTYTNPTADRTETHQDATGTLVLGEGTTTGGIDAGTTLLDGSNPTSVTTGLSALTACWVNRTIGTSPGVTAYIFTILRTAVAGRLDIYAWQPTSSSDPTLVASASTDRVEYGCVGTQ